MSRLAAWVDLTTIQILGLLVYSLKIMILQIFKCCIFLKLFHSAIKISILLRQLFYFSLLQIPSLQTPTEPEHRLRRIFFGKTCERRCLLSTGYTSPSIDWENIPEHCPVYPRQRQPVVPLACFSQDGWPGALLSRCQIGQIGVSKVHHQLTYSDTPVRLFASQCHRT